MAIVALTSRTQLLLEELSDKHGVFIMVVVQATHTFDVNGCDALIILLKNGKCEAIVLLCALITLFAIGKGRLMRFVSQERYKDALCGRFVEIRRGILMKV